MRPWGLYFKMPLTLHADAYYIHYYRFLTLVFGAPSSRVRDAVQRSGNTGPAEARDYPIEQSSALDHDH